MVTGRNDGWAGVGRHDWQEYDGIRRRLDQGSDPENLENPDQLAQSLLGMTGQSGSTTAAGFAVRRRYCCSDADCSAAART